MKRQRAILTLVVIPALISLAVTLAVLMIWDRRMADDEVLVLPTASNTSQPPLAGVLPAEEPAAGEQSAGAPASAAAPGEQEEPEITVRPPTSRPGSSGPDCQNPIHEVVSGEVLSTIAEQYGLPVDDLIEANQMLDPAFDANTLSIGQLIEIPTCGMPTPVVLPTDTPAPTRAVPTPIPTATPAPAGEISVTIERVLDPGDVTREAVDIRNLGSTVDLEGWVLKERGGSREFVFPALRLFTEGLVTVYTGVGENTVSRLYWGLDTAQWGPGDVVQLLDADGEVQAEFTVEG
ncbi:MAG: hypothetical protein Kow00124_10120 [Anaerolineae bacterium]